MESLGVLVQLPLSGRDVVAGIVLVGCVSSLSGCLTHDGPGRTARSAGAADGVRIVDAPDRPSDRPSERAADRPSDPATVVAAGFRACDLAGPVRADQVIVVRAHGTRTSVTACSRNGHGYVTAMGPFAGHAGRNGAAGAGRTDGVRVPGGVSVPRRDAARLLRWQRPGVVVRFS